MSRRLDLTGKKFGRLTGVSYAYTDNGLRYWLFECDCGNKIISTGRSVKNGQAKSCGCSRYGKTGAERENFTNKNFNMLTGIKYSHTDYHGRAHWLFKCDCGNKKVIDASSVKFGGTKSCGCISCGPEASKRHKKDGSADRLLYKNYMRKARKRGLVFDLTRNQFKILTESRCYYCGCEPCQVKDSNSKWAKPELYNGVDRADNSKGYLIDNCVPCCGPCNMAKYNQSQEVFLNHISKIYTYSILKSAGDI